GKPQQRDCIPCRASDPPRFQEWNGLLPESARRCQHYFEIVSTRMGKARLCNPERSAKSNFSPRLWYLQSACCRGSGIGCGALACAEDTSATGRTRRGEPPTTDDEVYLQAENSRVSLASSRLNP